MCVALQVTENCWWNVNSEKTTQILALNRDLTAKGHPLLARLVLGQVNI